MKLAKVGYYSGLVESAFSVTQGRFCIQGASLILIYLRLSPSCSGEGLPIPTDASPSSPSASLAPLCLLWPLGLPRHSSRCCSRGALPACCMATVSHMHEPTQIRSSTSWRHQMRLCGVDGRDQRCVRSLVPSPGWNPNRGRRVRLTSLGLRHWTDAWCKPSMQSNFADNSGSP
jgi:hypothetical protein